MLRDEIAQIYVQRYFSPEYKAVITNLANNLLAVMDKRIDQLSWMQPVTKAKVKEEAERLYRQDRLSRQVPRSICSARSCDPTVSSSAGRSAAPTQRSDWYMSPQTVNATATYNRLEITFPTAFLQAPVFDPKADPAVNYGAIGAIAGGTRSATISTTRAQNITRRACSPINWWTPEDLKAFDAAGKALIAQYDAYEPLSGEHIKGEFTLGENIGDLAGLTIAYDAYQRSLGGKPTPV